MPPVIWKSRELLEGINLTKLSKYRLSGVYIIFLGDKTNRVVRIGQGIIADRLAEHRNNKEIMYYKQFGELFVTWAVIQIHQLNGVERYLGTILSPLVGEKFPKSDEPIPVILPPYLRSLNQ